LSEVGRKTFKDVEFALQNSMALWMNAADGVTVSFIRGLEETAHCRGYVETCLFLVLWYYFV
jgi:hypothetical protein